MTARVPTTAMTAQSSGRLGPRLRAIALIVVFAAGIAVLGIVQVSHRHRLYEAGMDLSRQTLRYRKLLEENQRLRLELATIKQADRIREVARRRLGMRVPAPQEIVEVQP